MRLLIAPVTVWVSYGLLLFRAHRARRNSVNPMLTAKQRVDGGRCDAS
jgi:hypothetical protein